MYILSSIIDIQTIVLLISYPSISTILELITLPSYLSSIQFNCLYDPTNKYSSILTIPYVNLKGISSIEFID